MERNAFVKSASISVVIPAYNAGLFIAETLESVFAQTLQPDEILVIDDGSTDNTAAVAESFGERVRVFRRKNARQAASRNFGVQEAKTEWIAFLDADDVWEPQKLERQMAKLANHPEADVCYTGRIERRSAARRGDRVFVADPKSLRKALFRNTNFLPSSVVIRRAAFLAVGGFDTQFAVVEDWDLWLRLFHAGAKFTVCPEPLVFYRIHPRGDSNRAFEVLAQKEKIFREQVLPHLSKSTRWFRRIRATSEHEGCAAAVLQNLGDPRCLPLMVKSLLRSPFHEPYRYRRFARMIYSRLAGVKQPMTQHQE